MKNKFSGVEGERESIARVRAFALVSASSPHDRGNAKRGFFSVVLRGKEKKENGAAGAPGRQGRLEETWDDTVDTW
jgi:hypothetical protein